MYLLVTKYSSRNSKATRILFYKNLCTGPVSFYSSTSMFSLDHVSDHVKWSFVNSKPIILLIDMCLAHFCPVPVCSRYVTRNGARAGTIYIKIDPHFSTPLVQPLRAVCTLEVDRPPNLGYISCQCPLPIAPTKESKLFTATPVYAFQLKYI